MAGRRARLHVGVFQQLPHRQTEPRADAPQRLQRQVDLAPLERAVVGAMHADLIGKGFLAHLEALAAAAHRSAHTLGQGSVFQASDPTRRAVATLQSFM